MNYINAIERYHEYHDAIHELMASIITGIFDGKLFQNEKNLGNAMKWLTKNYPFVELIFTLDGNGIQTSHNISHRPVGIKTPDIGIGADRRHRPYYKMSTAGQGVIVTEPYLSTSSHHLCISSAIQYSDENGEGKDILVMDIDLADAIEFLMGDRKRKKFQPFFISIYTLIVVGLFSVVAILLYSAASEVIILFTRPLPEDLHLSPFGIIIYLTLALAIFDLGKTTLEEEVLMQKDIFRHSSTRRTITRFIAAILIAVSIEALLLMFKSALGSPEHLSSAVAMMAAAVGLLVGLGIYVYLGAKAEVLLKRSSFRKG